MIHSMKIKLSDYGIMDSNPDEKTREGDFKYEAFTKMNDNLPENWKPSVRMSTYVPSPEVEEWWRLYAKLFPNSFHGSAGLGSPCVFAKGTSVCPTKLLNEMDAFGKDFEQMIIDYGWATSEDELLLPEPEYRLDEFIGFERLEVELNRRYAGPEWKKEEFEKEVHKRMREELQKQIVAKVLMYLIIVVSTLVVVTVFSEMNLPIIPNLFRWTGTKINTVYKLIVPIVLISFGVYLQARMMQNNAAEFCRINPEAHSDTFGATFGSNCYDRSTPEARSMQKCGLGLRCFLNGKEIREIKERSNPFTNLECRQDFSKCGEYIKPGFEFIFLKHVTSSGIYHK